MSQINIIIGLPGAGKTTFVKDIVKEETIVLNKETIVGSSKEVVFEEIISFAKEGKDIILDGIFASKKSRKKIFKVAKEVGATVEVVYCASSIDTCINRAPEKKEKIIEAARDIDIPVIGKDCSTWSIFSTEDNKFSVEERIEELKSERHQSPFHLESIGTHISMVIHAIENDSSLLQEDKDILLEIAKYHDIEKSSLKKRKNGHFQYIGHEKASVNTYFANVFPYMEEVSFNESESQKMWIVALACADHMRAHRVSKKKKTYAPYAKTFAKYDDIAKVSTGVEVKKYIEDEITYYQYILTNNSFEVAKKVNSYNFNEIEKEVINKDIEYFKSIQNKIYTEEES